MLRFDQNLNHGVQNLGELLLKRTISLRHWSRLAHHCARLFAYLVQSFEEQDVFAGILKSAALLVGFGVDHARLGVLVLVLVGVVRLCTHCGGTRSTLRRRMVEDP